ncbi:bifunctional Ribosomal protein L1 [Babesia duncani]|uniref:Bifunctional Ribosomal protein L1 n=1 Tax=Babesia duncani TaxID=323732 RepID=A0AAD9UPC5_9APIC|nr:bifunctional Ribosomal protein L1 [Babesia duncani]
MAKSALYILDSNVKSKKVDKESLKLIKKQSGKPKKILRPVEHKAHNPSCLENAKVELDLDLLKKVIETLKKRAEVVRESNTRDLLEDPSRNYVFIQIALTKVVTEVHVKPLQIKLKHPIYTDKEVCIFVKDPQKHWKEIIKRENVPQIKKVIGVTKLKKKYKQFEDRRKLCRSFDLFLCDKAVCCSLPSLLGKVFIQRKKMPVPISMSKGGLGNSMREAIQSTYYKLSTGNTCSVKVGICSMNTEQLIDNIKQVFQTIKKFHTEDPIFRNVISSIFLNWEGTESLMLYSRALADDDIQIPQSHCKWFGTSQSDLVARIVATAKGGTTSLSVWRQFSKDVIETIDTLNIPDVYRILKCFSILRYRHDPLLNVISYRIVESLDKIACKNLAEILKAYSKLECRNDFLLKTALPTVARHLEFFTPSDLSSVFYSYCNLGFHDLNFIRQVEWRIFNTLGKLQSCDFALLFCGLTRLERINTRFVISLACQFCKSLDAIDEKHFSLCVNALGRLEFAEHPHLYGILVQHIYNEIKLHHLTSVSLALLVNGFSRAKPKDLKVFQMLSKVC